VTPPAAVRAGVEAATGSAILRVTAVAGGCISPAARIETSDGGRWFLKWGNARGLPAGLFAEEARSLRALRATGAVRVPAVIAAGPAWLLLEWLEPGGATRATWAGLGRELAALHRVRATRFGWDADNFIGTLPQANPSRADWPAFWREARLVPQLEQAAAAGHVDRAARTRFDRFLDRLDDLLAAGSADGPSLLHGDLWSGNVHIARDGAALVDPSSYHGHREVDLAMAELFGGFDPAFHAAYAEAWPLQPGYRPERRAAYQLYYLLVHVNLFGGGYVAGTLAALRAAGG
jgi:protein-ribulosamine 3-kinase